MEVVAAEKANRELEAKLSTEMVEIASLKSGLTPAGTLTAGSIVSEMPGQLKAMQAPHSDSRMPFAQGPSHCSTHPQRSPERGALSIVFLFLHVSPVFSRHVFMIFQGALCLNAAGAAERVGCRKIASCQSGERSPGKDAAGQQIVQAI